jgi:hypothetical protein
LGAYSVLKWGHEVEDSRVAWQVECTFARLGGNLYPKWKPNTDPMGYGCDDGENCVHVAAQRMPRWGPEISDSSSAWQVEGAPAQLHRESKLKMKKTNV